MSDDIGTLLVLSTMGVPFYSARGLTQTLAPIDMATSNFARTVNAVFVDLTPSQFRKYKSTITCTDQRSPSVDGIFPGDVVTVDCITELTYAEGGSPQRSVVDDSSYTETGFVHYRPRLTMVVTGFNISRDEYGATVGWELDLEEQ